MEFVSRANRVHVDPAWVLDVIRRTGFAHDNAEAVHNQMSAIVAVLQDVDVGHDERSMAAASISFRLEALTSLVLAVRKHRWDLPAPSRASITPQMLVRCACEQQLTVHKGRPAFDPASFGDCLRNMLREGAG